MPMKRPSTIYGSIHVSSMPLRTGGKIVGEWLRSGGLAAAKEPSFPGILPAKFSAASLRTAVIKM